MSAWINPKDNIPKDAAQVIGVYLTNTQPYYEILVYREDQWCSNITGDRRIAPDFWLPHDALPPLPPPHQGGVSAHAKGDVNG